MRFRDSSFAGLRRDAAAAWFAALAEAFVGEIGFDGRKRRPSPTLQMHFCPCAMSCWRIFCQASWKAVDSVIAA